MFHEVLKTLKTYKILFLITFFIMIITNALSLFMNIINQKLFDKVFYDRDIEFLLTRGIYIIISIYVSILVLGIATKKLSADLYANTIAIMRSKYFEKILNSHYLFFGDKKPSDLSYRMFTDIGTIHMYVLDILMNVPLRIMYAIIGFILLLRWSKILTLIYLFFVGLGIVSVLITRKYRAHIAKKQREWEQGLVTTIQENFYNILLIKSAGIEKNRITRGNKKIIEYSKIDSKNTLYFSLLSLINNFSNNIWSIVLIVVGAYLVIENQITIGAYVMFSSLASSISGIVLNLLDTVFRYPQACISYSRYKEYLENSVERVDGVGEKFSFTKFLTGENIDYGYPNGNKDVIHKMNFSFSPKMLVAIVGENGKGKTTLMNILARIIEEENLSIYIDGNNINKVCKVEYMKQVSYCTQKTELFNDTFIYNIFLDREDRMGNEDLLKLIKRLNMENLINELPQKMYTNIGPAGYQLSAGNIQKIGIIRALIGLPQIVLFDEPSSNLDIESKKNLYEFMKEYVEKNNALIMVVSHDNEFIEYADVIMYI